MFDLGEIKWGEGSTEGWAFEPQVGIDIKTKGKVVFNVGVGANYQIPVKKYEVVLYGSNSRATKWRDPIPSFMALTLHLGIKF